MDAQVPSIELHLRFAVRSALPAGLLARVIDYVERSVFSVEESELAAIMAEFEELTPLAEDATRYRLDSYKGRSVLVHSARDGSIVLLATVAGISVWVLQQTLGETLKEAWLESESHERLKRLLLRRVWSKATTVADVLSVGPEEVGADVELQASVVEEEDKHVVVVVVLPGRAETSPGGGEQLEAA